MRELGARESQISASSLSSHLPFLPDGPPAQWLAKVRRQGSTRQAMSKQKTELYVGAEAAAAKSRDPCCVQGIMAMRAPAAHLDMMKAMPTKLCVLRCAKKSGCSCGMVQRFICQRLAASFSKLTTL